MKKILISLLLIFTLCACSNAGKEVIDPDEKYLYIIDTIKNNDVFQTSSQFFDISTEISTINDGYAYYITIDNPRISMYRIEAVVIEKDVDYSKSMAANIGVFEDMDYNIVPNQTKPDEGFVKGVIISGTTKNPSTSLYMYVQFYNSDYSVLTSEYIKLDISIED